MLHRFIAETEATVLVATSRAPATELFDAIWRIDGGAVRIEATEQQMSS